MRISDWSSDVCSSDLGRHGPADVADVGRGERLAVGAVVADLRGLCQQRRRFQRLLQRSREVGVVSVVVDAASCAQAGVEHLPQRVVRQHAENAAALLRSEEHTSELQSLMRTSYAVFCLKKKKTTKDNTV